MRPPQRGHDGFTAHFHQTRLELCGSMTHMSGRKGPHSSGVACQLVVWLCSAFKDWSEAALHPALQVTAILCVIWTAFDAILFR